MDKGVVHKAYRIHVSALLNGLWLSKIVSIGDRKPITKDSLTDTVTRVPGEYPSKAEALQAAKQYIDKVEEASKPW